MRKGHVLPQLLDPHAGRAPLIARELGGEPHVAELAARVGRRGVGRFAARDAVGRRAISRCVRISSASSAVRRARAPRQPLEHAHVPPESAGS